ncbi:hypothetical protein LRP49_06840 [Enterovibrio sp. ZSDZ35]|uniref:Uncharacterized protein n=1 Tax=Enterovibrio qingdaonensis TaxID=2899818 RepID=A0ABT5QIU8_9GAMM|nr:hypothetical protein [Enterovibrio sp. ZSDZ35]MDD1780917.1 hypothetical protein [Enterovibrio sp. ZSDZ35]
MEKFVAVRYNRDNLPTSLLHNELNGMLLLLSRRNGYLLSAVFSALLVFTTMSAWRNESASYAFFAYVSFGLTLVFLLRATRFMYTIEMLQGDKATLVKHMLIMATKLILLPGLTTYLWFQHQRLLKQMIEANRSTPDENKLPEADMHVAPTSLIKTYLDIIKPKH